MPSAFLDSNVVLHLLSADAAKANRAEALLMEGAVVSVQVLDEVTSVCLRKLRMPWPEIETLVGTVNAHCDVQPLTAQSHAQAMRLAQRHRLSFHDAHIVSSALSAGASMLYSEDMHDGLAIGGLQIRNPFVG